MRTHRLIAAILLVTGLLAAEVAAQDTKTLRIAGLTLGIPNSDLATSLSKHGFFALPAPTDPRQIQREATRINRVSVFQRRDGHILRVGVQRGEVPVIRSLDYNMGGDIDSYELIRAHLRGLYGPPTAVHGSKTAIRLAKWEVPGTDMNIDGLLTTSITLVKNPVEGHSMMARELRVRPEFLGRSGRSRTGVAATE